MIVLAVQILIFYFLIWREIKEYYPVMAIIIFPFMALLSLFMYGAIFGDRNTRIIFFFGTIGSFLVGSVVVRLVFSGIDTAAQKFVDKMFGFMPEKEKRESHKKALQLTSQQKFREAIENFRDILKNDPNDVTAQLRIALIQHTHLRDFQRALVEYKKVLAMNPKPQIKRFVKMQINEILSGRGDETIVSWQVRDFGG